VINPSNTSHLYVGTSQGIFESKDGGEVWVSKQEGLGNLNIRALVMDPINFQILYCGTNGSGLYKSTDSGNSWMPIPLTLVP